MHHLGGNEMTDGKDIAAAVLYIVCQNAGHASQSMGMETSSRNNGDDFEK
jgi:hypothetical protein